MKNRNNLSRFFAILLVLSIFIHPAKLQAEENLSILDKTYVTSFDTGVVDVINLKTNTVEKAKIKVGSMPNSAGFNPNGNQVFVTNRGNGTVSVIDPVTDTVIKTISVGKDPHGVAFTTDGTRAYVANYSSSSLSVIDTSSLEVIDTINVPMQPVAMVVVGTDLYLTTFQSVIIIDMKTDTIKKEIPMTDPYGISVNPAKTKLYVAQRAMGTVSVINIADQAVEATVTVGSGPHSTEVSPDGSRVYVVNASSSTVSVIDSSTNTVIDTITVGSFPYVIGLSKDGKFAYSVNYGSDDMSVIDTTTNTVIHTIGLSEGPFMVGTFMVPTAISTAPIQSSNADLASITLSSGTLDQSFDKNITEYEVNVENEVETMLVTSEVADEKATQVINGIKVVSGHASQPIELTEGNNDITIEVTAEDGVTVKTYTISVNRLPKVVAPPINEDEDPTTTTPIEETNDEEKTNDEEVNNNHSPQETNDNVSDKETESNDLQEEETSSNELPKTATNIYNLLILGSILVLAGIVVVVKQRKYSK